MNRLNRNLKVHYNYVNRILCMPNTSENYLYPHLTTDKGRVTCVKCLDVLQRMRKGYVDFINR